MTFITMATLRARAAGLAAATALVVIVGLLPLALIKVGGNPHPQHLPTWPGLRGALTSPDDGTLALQVVTVIAWLAWVSLSGSVLIEVIARVRGISTPHLPGLRLPQLTANTLVSTAAMLFITTPVLLHATPSAHAEPALSPSVHLVTSNAVPTPAHTATAPILQFPRDQHRPAPVQPSVTAAPHATVNPYMVKRGDSLWSIAERHLGSGLRYQDIAHLNAKVLHGRPGFLIPGTVLNLPTGGEVEVHRDGDADQVLVKRGDTLSAIAEAELGAADRYPEIFDESTSTLQPGGAHLSDPDLIDIGWTLTIPSAHHTQKSHEPPEPVPRHNLARPSSPDRGTPTKRVQPRPMDPAPTPPHPQPSASPASRSASSSASTAETPNRRLDAPATRAQPEPAESAPPAWLLTGLTGGGAVLAGSMLLVLRRRRRDQFRRRQPGRTIAQPAPALVPVDKTLTARGDMVAPTLSFIDTVLRALAAAQTGAGEDMPEVAALEVSGSKVRLHLTEPARLPQPWQGTEDQLSWTVEQCSPQHSGTAVVDDQPAPYPLLATIGSTETGDVWLLNFEHVGTASITEDTMYGQDFVRYLAAELACNPWSQNATVDCVGTADEVVPMNPERLKHRHDATAAAAVSELITDAKSTIERSGDIHTNVTSARSQQLGADAWPARMLLLHATDNLPGKVTELIQLIEDHPGRTGIAVVAVGAAAPTTGVQLAFADGRISLPQAQLDLIAVGLTADEAQGCAAILAQAEDADDTEIPSRHDADGWRAYTNDAGALRAEHTLPRHTPADDSAEPAQSILDAADEQYVEKAATTIHDLEALAPQVPLRIRDELERADSNLDADVALWFDPNCPLPRLALLGPVIARTRGAAIAKRRPYYTELLTFLATRPHGATPDEVAEALTITGARVRNDVKIVRDWLGTNARTGRQHLPDARETQAGIARGVGVYQVEDLLTDLDLFRRLRARGEASGPTGLTDLVAALKLVTGQPFDKLRPGGWAWLHEGDRLDHHMVCAIVDVAHLVTTHGLQAQQIDIAQAAAEIARLAAPYDEIPRLDLAAVATAKGNHREAARIVNDDICNRSDDGLPPTELSQRTKQILDNRRWLTRDIAG